MPYFSKLYLFASGAKTLKGVSFKILSILQEKVHVRLVVHFGPVTVFLKSHQTVNNMKNLATTSMSTRKQISESSIPV